MATIEQREMSAEEALRSQLFMARNRISDLEGQLSALNEQVEQMQHRLTLSERETKLLEGQGDGCVRIGDLRPIVQRVFGEAA